MLCGDGPAKGRRNDTRTDSLLPERALGTDRIADYGRCSLDGHSRTSTGAVPEERGRRAAWKEYFYVVALQDDQFEHPDPP